MYCFADPPYIIPKQRHAIMPICRGMSHRAHNSSPCPLARTSHHNQPYSLNCTVEGEAGRRRCSHHNETHSLKCHTQYVCICPHRAQAKHDDEICTQPTDRNPWSSIHRLCVSHTPDVHRDHTHVAAELNARHTTTCAIGMGVMLPHVVRLPPSSPRLALTCPHAPSPYA